MLLTGMWQPRYRSQAELIIMFCCQLSLTHRKETRVTQPGPRTWDHLPTDSAQVSWSQQHGPMFPDRDRFLAFDWSKPESVFSEHWSFHIGKSVPHLSIHPWDDQLLIPFYCLLYSHWLIEVEYRESHDTKRQTFDNRPFMSDVVSVDMGGYKIKKEIKKLLFYLPKSCCKIVQLVIKCCRMIILNYWHLIVMSKEAKFYRVNQFNLFTLLRYSF